MTNLQISKAFAAGEDHGKSLNMFIDGNRVYSYGYHFPIAEMTDKRFNDHQIVLFTTHGYSVTTSHHKSEVYNALVQAGYLIIECDLNQPTLKKDLISEFGLRARQYLAKEQRARKDYMRESWAHRVEEMANAIKVVEFCF